MRKFPWRAWILVCVGVGVACVAGYVYVLVFQPKPVPAQSRYVFVRQGATLAEVVSDLQARGIIARSGPLALVARITGIGTRLKAGGYRLTERMSAYQVLQKIESGKVDLVRVTIPEGFTIEQIAARLATKGVCSDQRFRFLARNPVGSVSLLTWAPQGSLEGFLYPDTYFLPLNQPEEKVLLRLLESFDDAVLKPLKSDFAANSMGLGEIVTLASLVEREARRPEERPLIAGVLMNRLRQGKRLECDATIQYALGEHRKRLFYEDLKIDSPYNTYRFAGLPPGPIANPGLASLKAALHPAPTDCLFYVAKPDGSHVFSRTFEEHQAAIRRIRAMKAR